MNNRPELRVKILSLHSLRLIFVANILFLREKKYQAGWKFSMLKTGLLQIKKKSQNYATINYKRQALNGNVKREKSVLAASLVLPVAEICNNQLELMKQRSIRIFK